MSELIVVGFKKDMYRASAVLNILRDMNNSWVVDLDDAVAVYRDNKGKLRVDQSYQLSTGEGAAWGGILGVLIGGLIAIPFTGGASAAASASAAAAMATGTLGGAAVGAGIGALNAESWKEDFGISEEFVRSIGAMVQTGDSAIFALLRTVNPDLMAEQFRGYGGTILRTTLSPAQKARVEEVLHSR